MTARLVLHGVIKDRRDGARRFRLLLNDLVLIPGTRLALVGPSGCGKSTAVDIAALGMAPDRTKLFTLFPPDGEAVDVAALWKAGRRDTLARLRARHFGYVLQTGGLLPFLRVRDNIALPQRIAGRRDDALIDHLCGRLGIAALREAYPARLSVGQRQRVAIARALATRPDFILADEPTASLDPANAREAMALFVELATECNAALLVATHDSELALAAGLSIVAAASDDSAKGWATRFRGNGVQA